MKPKASNLQSRLAASVTWITVVGLTGLFLFSIASPAGAVLSGENGRIVLVSGRPPETDATARLYLLPVPSNSSGGGLISSPIVPSGGQYRHPSWSPDRTKIVFANGTAGVYDLFVIDLVAGTGPVQITPTESPTNLSADRPAWSPDGSTIVYEHQPAAASTDRHIRSQSALDLQLPINTTDLTAAGAPFEGKPAWSPDSQTVYFHRGDPQAAGNSDIYRKPAGGGAEVLAVSDSGISEAQPSISPDGTQICYTLTNAGFNNTAEVLVGPLTTPPSGGLIVSKQPAVGDYNCTWSPDGQLVAYVSGIFGNGRLVMVEADNTSPIEIDLADSAAVFDGNPDWAPDGRPECQDLTITTVVDQATSFSVSCPDTGPEYEQTEVKEYADSQPTNGTLTQEFAGDPFSYQPNPGFIGSDTFEVNSFDELGFGIERGTVTINVLDPDPPDPPPPNPGNRKCSGSTATIVGMAGKDRLRGTPGIDIITGLGGSDVIKGLGGVDLICGGIGNDRLIGLGGRDRLLGQAGRDVLKGGKGPDRLNGGAGRDRQFGGPGRDRLLGGAGRDLCNGGPSRDRGSSCERRIAIP